MIAYSFFVCVWFVFVSLLAQNAMLCAKIYIGVRAGARTGYVIPGRDGNGGWRFGEILPPSPSSPSSGGRGRGEAGGIRNTSYTGAILHADRKSNGRDYKSMLGL